MINDNIDCLQGQHVTLRPINASRDAVQLYKDLNHPPLWDFFSYRPHDSLQNFHFYVTKLEQQKAHMTNNYTIRKSTTNQALGFIGINHRQFEQRNSLQIVNVMFSLKLQKTTMATESFYLIAKHCFDMLHCNQLHWWCDSKNTNSCRAALRFGFYDKGIQSQKYKNYQFFYMIKQQWDEFIQDQYKRWLDAKNFDEKGLQKTKLEIRKH